FASRKRSLTISPCSPRARTAENGETRRQDPDGRPEPVEVASGTPATDFVRNHRGLHRQNCRARPPLHTLRPSGISRRDGREPGEYASLLPDRRGGLDGTHFAKILSCVM